MKALENYKVATNELIDVIKNDSIDNAIIVAFLESFMPHWLASLVVTFFNVRSLSDESQSV